MNSVRIVNVGVSTTDGKRVATPLDLIELINSSLDLLTFDRTSLFDSELPITAREFPKHTMLQVIGPDPYRKREWMACLELIGGKVGVVEVIYR